MTKRMRLVLAVAFCSFWMLTACGGNGGSGDTPISDGDTNDTVEQNDGQDQDVADGDGAEKDDDTDDTATEGERADVETAESEADESLEREESGDTETEMEGESDSEAESDDDGCHCGSYTGTYCLEADNRKATQDLCTLLEVGLFAKAKIDELTTGCGLRLAAMQGQNELAYKTIEGERCPDLFDGEPEAANDCKLFYSDDRSDVTVICMDKNSSATCERRFSKGACPEIHCFDHEQNQGESDTDCGGGCAPCELGAACKRIQDCLSGDCYQERCAAPKCPDGRTSGSELCDDDNSEPGDGCDTDCQVEAGFFCDGTPSICKPICGDGQVIAGREDCDDGSTENDDGCSSLCTIEPGYTCKGSPSTCRPICTQDGDCKAPANPCLVATCVDGGCSTLPRAAGPLATQTPGDCLRAECDGNGNILQMADGTDALASDTTCRSYSCANGQNVPLNAATATPCNDHGGSLCDGNGACVACLSELDCPGTDSACRKRSCDLFACGFVNTTSGTAIDEQTPGDCKRNVCDGSGNVSTVIDDQDIPVAGICKTGTCNQGVPGQINSGAGNNCGVGLVCDGAGQCVGCINPSGCPGVDNECGMRICLAGTCGMNYAPLGLPLGGQVGGDCQELQCDGAGGTRNSPNNADTPLDDGKSCTFEVCQAGMPAHPPKNAGTPCTQDGGRLCDGAGACVECMMGFDCSSGVCKENVCQAPSCTDGIANGDEMGLDCGGSCPNACPKLAMAVSGSSDGVWGAVYDSQGSWQLAKLAAATGYAEVAMEASGRVTLVSRDSATSLLSYSNYDPKTTLFSPLSELGPTITGLSLSLAPAENGTYMAFHGTNYALYFAIENGAGIWSPIAEPIGQVGPSGGTLATAGIFTDVLYVQDGTNRISDTSRLNGVWKAPIVISTDRPNIWLKPAAAVNASGGGLLTVWASENNRLFFSFRIQGSGIWSIPMMIPNATSINRPALTAMANGTFLLAFRGEDGYLYHAVYDGVTWTAPAPLHTPNFSADDTPGLAGSSIGAEAELVYTDGGKVYHTRYVGGTWTAPYLITSGSFSKVSLSARP